MPRGLNVRVGELSLGLNGTSGGFGDVINTTLLGTA